MKENLHKAVAIIPARGGSKRIPGKNIRPFCGVPIIEHSIKAALKSGCFQEVMVSTDDNAIAEIARSAGACVPFMRSAKTSGDHSTTVDVIEEVLSEYRRSGKVFSVFACIYPTAPFVTAIRLKQAFELLLSTGVDSVFPIVRFSYPIGRSLKIEDGRVKMNWPENYSARSQDLPPAFHDAGQFYFMNSGSFESQKKLFAANSMGIEVPETEAQDIDSEVDWKLAELKFKFLKGDPSC